MEHRTRIGKIARLPSAIREELNQRLDEGDPQILLLRWLNDLPAVRERLDTLFQGRPITQQNLSDWKKGGFLDWRRQMDARGLARDFFAEAAELGQETDGAALLDQVADSVALALLRLFRATSEEAMEGAGSTQRREVLEIARELSRLRRGDHLRQKLGLQADKATAAAARQAPRA